MDPIPCREKQARHALDEQLDRENELSAVVGTKLADGDEETALAGVFGSAMSNDISARTCQRHTHQWTHGVNINRPGVIGAIVNANEVGDRADRFKLETRLNGQVMQSASMSDMIFPAGAILAYFSPSMTFITVISS